MTKRANNLFFFWGALGFGAMIVASGINAFVWWLGYDNSMFQSFLQLSVLPVGMASFVSLFWFGLIPRLAQRMYSPHNYSRTRYVDWLSAVAGENQMRRLGLLIDEPRQTFDSTSDRIDTEQQAGKNTKCF